MVYKQALNYKVTLSVSVLAFTQVRPLAIMLCKVVNLSLSLQVLATLAWYPGHVFGGNSGLVSTVCACANDSGNFP